MRTRAQDLYFLRRRMIDVAWTMINVPYRWGGPQLMPSVGKWYFGLDCSGFTGECLKSVGLMRHEEDLSAAGQYGRFIAHRIEEPRRGALIFWLADHTPTHVCICLDEHLVIGAIGGGAEVTTLDEALKRDARVKVRPITYRSTGRIVYCDPFLSLLKPPGGAT